MRLRLAAAAALTALVGLAVPASAAPLKVTDPTGDANFSGLHNGAIPAASIGGLDLVAVTFQTTTKTTLVGKKKVVTHTHLKLTLTTAAAPSTAPTASYGIVAEHSLCGQLRLQIYYSPTGAETYGDLAGCGANTDPTATNPEQFRISFAPKISGKNLVIEIPFKSLPKQFKVGSRVSGITAYTSTAEFVVAGYQPTDFEPSAGIDIAATDKSWKVG